MEVKKTTKIRPIIYKKLYNNINYDYLDKNYKHYLITGEESWSSIEKKYWFRVKLTDNSTDNSTDNDSWWDIRSLLVHITQCLNSCNMGNPCPQFPSDPFTRIPYTYDSICEIYTRCKELQLNLHCSTLTFFYSYTSSPSKIRKHIMNSDEINSIMCKWLRYRNINSQDSQGNFIGIWEPKYSMINQFERQYIQYCQHPPYIFEYGQEIVNPKRKILENMLHQLPKEEWNHELDTYPAYVHPSHISAIVPTSTSMPTSTSTITILAIVPVLSS